MCSQRPSAWSPVCSIVAQAPPTSTSRTAARSQFDSGTIKIAPRWHQLRLPECPSVTPVPALRWSARPPTWCCGSLQGTVRGSCAFLPNSSKSWSRWSQNQNPPLQQHRRWAGLHLCVFYLLFLESSIMLLLSTLFLSRFCANDSVRSIILLMKLLTSISLYILSLINS